MEAQEHSYGESTSSAQKTVATYAGYRQAERAVDHLSDMGFPVERVTIVGHGLNMVERVTGRLTRGRAVINGAVAGAFVGFMIGWLWAVFTWFDPVVARGWLMFDGLWFGALAGALAGLVGHVLQGGRRDFSSVSTMRADHYDVVVDGEVADEAGRLLGSLAEPAPGQPEREKQRARHVGASPA
jgi:hypothetical protein